GDSRAVPPTGTARCAGDAHRGPRGSAAPHRRDARQPGDRGPAARVAAGFDRARRHVARQVANPRARDARHAGRGDADRRRRKRPHGGQPPRSVRPDRDAGRSARARRGGQHGLDLPGHGGQRGPSDRCDRRTAAGVRVARLDHGSPRPRPRAARHHGARARHRRLRRGARAGVAARRRERSGPRDASGLGGGGSGARSGRNADDRPRRWRAACTRRIPTRIARARQGSGRLRIGERLVLPRDGAWRRRRDTGSAGGAVELRDPLATVAAMRLSTVLVIALPAALLGSTAARAQTPTPAAAVASTPAPASNPAAEDSVRRVAIDKLTSFISRYPNSTLRPNALFQLAELLVRRADDAFAAAQRAGSNDLTQPDYAAAVARYEELVGKYPNFVNGDAAAYTLGTLYAADARYAD